MILALEQIKEILKKKNYLTSEEIERILDDKSLSKKDRLSVEKFLMDNNIDIIDETNDKEISEDIIDTDEVIESSSEDLMEVNMEDITLDKSNDPIYGYVESFLKSNNIELDAETEDDFVKEIGVYSEEEYTYQNIVDFLESIGATGNIDQKSIMTLAKKINRENNRKFETGRYINDSVKMYLADIGKIPLYTDEEEKEMAHAIKDQREKVEEIKSKIVEDLTVQLGRTPSDFEIDKVLNKTPENEKLIELQKEFASHNLRLVVSIAKRYSTSSDNLLDLIQEGNIGLQRAIEKYDIDKGFKFSTYATWWVRQAITRSIADHSRTIRIPVHLHEQINKLKRAERELTAILGRTPTNDELADVLNKTPEKVEELQKYSIAPVSMDSPIKNDDGDNDSLLVDFIADNKPTPEEETLQTELRKNVSKILNMIDNRRARRVLIYRFGLYNDNFSEQELEATVLRYVIATLPLSKIKTLPEPIMEDVIRNMTTRNADIIKDYIITNLPEDIKDQQISEIKPEYINRLSAPERRKIYISLYGDSILSENPNLGQVDFKIKDFFTNVDVYELRKACEEKLSSKEKGLILTGMLPSEKTEFINSLDTSNFDESLQFAKEVIDIKEGKQRTYPFRNFATYDDTIESKAMKNIVLNDPYNEQLKNHEEYLDACLIAKTYGELFRTDVYPSTLLYLKHNFENRYYNAHQKFQQGRTATLEDVGQLEDVTRERIRQIEAKTLRQIKQKEKRKVISIKEFITVE